MKIFQTSAIFLVLILAQTEGDDYVARYQPELENISIDSYINNPRLINLETQCLLYDGPCDIVGRFLKPRIAKGLLGECVLCTPKQANTLQHLLVWVQTNRPELYRLAIAKYLENAGITLPPGEMVKFEKLEKNEQATNATAGSTTPITIN